MSARLLLSSAARARAVLVSSAAPSSSSAAPMAAARAARAARGFSSSARRMDGASAVGGGGGSAAALPARKPMGAFRGGLFGFLLGATAAGTGVYYYVLQEYKASNELLQEDIYALQAATARMSNYLGTLEEKVNAVERKKK